jgi:hypothetical protein
MTPAKRYAKKHAKAMQRRRLSAKERHEHQQRKAQRAIDALHQALHDVGWPDDLVLESEGRLRSQSKLLGKIFALMFPPLFGCRSAHELTWTRGWDKNVPSRMLGALPQRSWLTRWRKLGQDLVPTLGRRVEAMSAATRSRWPLTPVIDDSVCRKYGGPLELGGRWWRGPPKRVVSGIDGVLLVIVIGEGHLGVPIDFVVRRPNPQGPGARCRDKLPWAKVLLDETLGALARRSLGLPPPLAVAESWLSDSQWMRHVAEVPQGTLLVQGKAIYPCYLDDGRQVHGHDFIHNDDWPWPHSLHAPDCRYGRLRAKSPTSGAVTVILVAKPGDDRFYRLCLGTQVQVTRLLRAWARRHLIEQVCRILKHLLATEACPVQSEDAYYGHLVRRLIASSLLYYTSRMIFKGRVTMDEMVFHVKHHWSSVTCEPLELFGVS